MGAIKSMFPVLRSLCLSAFLAIVGACTLVGPEAVVATFGRITVGGARSTVDLVKGWSRVWQAERIAWQREQYARAVIRRDELTRRIEMLRSTRNEAVSRLAEDRKTLRTIQRVLATQEGELISVGLARCPRSEVERDAYEVLRSCVELGRIVDRHNTSIQRLSADIGELDRQLSGTARSLRAAEWDLARREDEERGLQARAELMELLEDLKGKRAIWPTPL